MRVGCTNTVSSLGLAKDRRRRRQHRAKTASRSLRRGGGATAVVAVAVAIEEGYQCEWDALTLCLHLA